MFRDGFLYPEKNILASELLKLSNSLFEKEKCIFPISEDIFMEIMKQTDATTLKITVDLIDKLSHGVTLLSFDERFNLEVLDFWHTTTNKTVYEASQLIWSKLAYNMGFYSFYDANFTVKNNLKLQKAFIERLWNMEYDIVRND